jgi:hypothetical protein
MARTNRRLSFKDCADESDELSATCRKLHHVLIVKKLVDSTSFFFLLLLLLLLPLTFLSAAFSRFCTHDQFTCKSSKLCIPKSNLCDTITHCHDRSDEMSCSCPIEDDVSEKLFFRCGLTNKCLPKTVECYIKQECNAMLINSDVDEDDNEHDYYHSDDAECKS